jgi:transcriptional regulator with XRE-family HTH domain
VATKQRAVDIGNERGRRLVMSLGAEVRQARIDRGLSLLEVGRAVDLSPASLSRIERGRVPGVELVQLARMMSVVGLELSARGFPGPQPIRDAAQVRLLGRFRANLHRDLRWATEVPLPHPGDQRAWDAMVARGSDWRYGVEAETAPRDSQALLRRLNHKVRDGEVNGVILVLQVSRRTRDFLEAAGADLGSTFPVGGHRALELLAAGVDPGGNAIVVV